MKKILLFASACLLIFSCNKDDSGQYDSGSNHSAEFKEPSEINIYSEKIYTQEEFCDMVGESFDDYLDFVFLKDYNFIVKNTVSEIFDNNADAVDSAVSEETGCSIWQARGKWSVKIYNFTYKTQSYAGDPVILSAALCVPVLDDGSAHTLNAMTLGQPHMPIDKEFCPTMNGNILMTRVAYNHAVVIPDYQGRGITSSSPYSSFHTHDHAVQSIDAALAAMTIITGEGFATAKDFSLYNIGVSEGGEASYESHKMLENEVPASLRERLNLKLSFCANGIAKHAGYIDDRLANYEYNEYTHESEMDFFKDAFDCFTEEEKQGHNGEEFYSKDLLKGSKLDSEAPIFKVLKEGVLRNDITENWNPQHPITLAASKDDDDVYFSSNTQYMYDLLKTTPSGNPNRNVNLMAFNTPVSSLIGGFLGPDWMIAHVIADICCFIHAIRLEDPGSEPVMVGLPDNLYDYLKTK